MCQRLPALVPGFFVLKRCFMTLPLLLLCLSELPLALPGSLLHYAQVPSSSTHPPCERTNLPFWGGRAQVAFLSALLNAFKTSNLKELHWNCKLISQGTLHHSFPKSVLPHCSLLETSVIGLERMKRKQICPGKLATDSWVAPWCRDSDPEL